MRILDRAFGHRARDGFRYRAHIGDQIAGNTQHVLLGAVGIDDEAAIEHIRRTGNLRQKPAINPPVQLSAVAMRSFFSRASASTTSARRRSGEENIAQIRPRLVTTATIRPANKPATISSAMMPKPTAQPLRLGDRPELGDVE